jgi:spore coat protein U-like protein
MTFRNLYRKTAIALAVTGALAGGQVIANDTDTLTVTAGVDATCDITSVEVLNFGTLDLVNDATSSADITWVCTNGFDTTIALNGGGTSNINNRNMVGASNGDSLVYQLYTDAGLGTVFGDGANGSTVPANGAGFGNAQTTTVHGQVLASDAENVSADTYNDNVTVTITF